MSGFSHDVAGGSGNMVTTAMQSPGFDPATQGWQVARDGSATFNNGTFRGGIQATTFTGDDFLINTSGIFFYAT